MHSTLTYCEIISGVYGKAAEDATVNIHKICKIIDKNIEKVKVGQKIRVKFEKNSVFDF